MIDSVPGVSAREQSVLYDGCPSILGEPLVYTIGQMQFLQVGRMLSLRLSGFYLDVGGPICLAVSTEVREANHTLTHRIAWYATLCNYYPGQKRANR